MRRVIARPGVVACAFMLASACATPPLPSDVGRLYHYVRSNDDGTLPEDIFVHRESATRVAVHKAVSRCTNSAYVTAELDASSGEARSLVGGRLARDLSQDAFATLSFDASTRTITVKGAGLDESLTVGTAPWRLFDFDLADVGALDRERALARRDYRLSVALLWPVADAPRMMRALGDAVFTYAGSELASGADAVRYDVSGALNGRIWFDAGRGHVVAARFAEPNHTEYRSFRLELRDMSDQGAAAWRAALADHWKDCPPA